MVEKRVEKIQKLISESDEIPETLENKNALLDKQLKGHLPVVCCECGAEILIVPDLKAMDLAIEAHVSEHRVKERKVEDKLRVSRKISQLLGQLTLKKVGEMSDSKFSST